MRAESVAELPDAAERGLLAHPWMPPIDSTAWLANAEAAWTAADPETSTAPLFDAIRTLHPTARHGYVMLLALLADFRFDRHGADEHLARECGDAWPIYVLALRTSTASRSTPLRFLVKGRVRAAAPYLLSMLRHPIDNHTVVIDCAEAYRELGEVDVSEWLPHLEPTSTQLARAIAFRLLRDHGADDRVFAGYLRNFCAALPHSWDALKKRKRDPRIEAALLEQFERQEAASLKDGKHLRYTPEYGMLARHLAKLGNHRGKQAAARYKQFSNFGKGGWGSGEI